MRYPVYLCLLCLSHLVVANVFQRLSLSKLLARREDGHSLTGLRKLSLLNILIPRQEE